MNRLVISAPFGNWYQPAWATPTLGTFTLGYRGGILRRLWRCALTLRPAPGGWTNALGLPNPGIGSYTPPRREHIVSIHGFNRDEWTNLVRGMWYPPRYVEFNLSCPNVGRAKVDEVLLALKAVISTPIAKLPPIRWMDWVGPLWDAGVTHFHLCNTIPTPKGGLSGKALTPYSLWAVEEVRAKYPNAIIIGGGGVYDAATAKRYLEAGANSVALASILLSPFRWPEVRRIKEAVSLTL